MFKKSIIAITTAALVSNLYAIEKMDDVIITTKTNSKSTLDAPGSISIITQKDIKEMNANSLKDVLEELPGVMIGVNDSSIQGRQTISIRGTDSKHSLILVDGKMISGSDAQVGHSNFQYNWIPLSAIERIEVVRGSMSALYGSRAIGGVVNIITKKPENDANGELDLKFGKGRYDGAEHSQSLVVGGKVTEDLSMSMFAEHKKQDISTKQDNGDTISIQEGTTVKNVMLNAWYNIDETQSLKASFLYSGEIRSTPSYDEYYDIDKKHYSLGYSKKFDDIIFDLQYYKTKSDSHTDDFEYTHRLDSDTVNAEVSIASFDNNYIVVGAEYKEDYYRKEYDDISDDTSKGFEDEIKYRSAYIQDDIELTEDLTLTLGARYDKHEKFDAEISPKANLVYKLSNNSRLKVGYGEGFNAPTLTQNSSEYSVSIPTEFHSMFGFPIEFHSFVGNDDLQPETSKSFELGYEYEEKDLVFKTTIYHTKIKDLIDTIYQGDTISNPYGPGTDVTYSTYLYDNIDRAEFTGLELEFAKALNETFDMNLVYNYLKARDISGDEELLGKPRHKVNLKLNANLADNAKSTLRINYIGKQRTWNENGTYSDGTDDYKYSQKGYVTVGLQFSKDFNNGIVGRVGVENLMNEQLNRGETMYQITGRMIYFGLNYKF